MKLRVIVVLFGLAGLASGGCSRAVPRADTTPVIVVEGHGLAERLALMDRYRLHDEDRKRMMARPHVWVEEVPEDEELPAPEDEQPAEQPEVSAR